MLPLLGKIIYLTAISALLLGSVFSSLAAPYEPLLNFVICMGAVFLAQRAVRSKDYIRAAGFTAIVIIASPLLLVERVFLFMGFIGIVTALALIAAFRARPLSTE